MKFWTHPDYHNGKLRKLLQSMDDTTLEVKHGNFSIKYTGYDNSSYFGIFSWKGCMCRNTHVEFYENDVLLYTKEIPRPREFHFVIGGDGMTRENTFYLWFGKDASGYQCAKINDFNDKHIKEASLGPDCYTGLISVSDNYFVAITEEMCTFSRFFGLINKENFFVEETKKCWDGTLNIPATENVSLEEQLKNAQEIVQNMSLPHPYNDARIGLCVDWHDQCSECMEPVEATNEGLIFADVKFSDDYKEKSYTKTELVLYADVASYDQ